MHLKPHPKPNRFENHAKKTLFLGFLLFVLVLDFGLTGAYHLFKYGTIHKYADRKALRAASPVFHHTLKANHQHSAEKWGHISHSLSTNSLGFKDRAPREVPLSSTQYRILFMGDSFTEGVGYEYEKTFVGQLDEALKKYEVDILNAAVGSYSPTIYFKKTEYLLETVGLEFDHLIVFLDISDIQDEKEMYDIRDGKVVWLGGQDSKIKDFIFEYTGFLKNIWTLMLNIQHHITPDPESLRTEEEIKYGINRHRSLWTVREDIYAAFGQGGLAKADRYMNKLYQLIQSHKLEMSIAVYPWPDQIFNNDLESIQVQFWREWAKKHSVAFFNFFPIFILSEGNPKDILKQYFIQGDVHWNEKGHLLIAKNFLEMWQKTSPGLFNSVKGDISPLHQVVEDK
jgi:hypothetical protein